MDALFYYVPGPFSKKPVKFFFCPKRQAPCTYNFDGIMPHVFFFRIVSHIKRSIQIEIAKKILGRAKERAATWRLTGKRF